MRGFPRSTLSRIHRSTTCFFFSFQKQILSNLHFPYGISLFKKNHTRCIRHHNQDSKVEQIFGSKGIMTMTTFSFRYTHMCPTVTLPHALFVTLGPGSDKINHKVGHCLKTLDYWYFGRRQFISKIHLGSRILMIIVCCPLPFLLFGTRIVRNSCHLMQVS